MVGKPEATATGGSQQIEIEQELKLHPGFAATWPELVTHKYLDGERNGLKSLLSLLSQR